MEKRDSYREGNAQHQLILLEAKKQGIEVNDVSEEYGRLAALLILDKQEELIVQGIPHSWMNERATRLCDEKQLTKELFNQLNIPSPESFLFSNPPELKGLNVFNDETKFVCKPIIGTNGVGVVLNLNSLEDVEAYYEDNKALSSQFLLEQMCVGYDLRIQVINGAIEAACVRKPAYVIGNGEDSLQDLISERKRVIHNQNPANGLTIDEQSASLIENQGYSLQSIIPLDIEVKLKKVSNMAQGGHAVDVTHELSPLFSDWINKIKGELKTGYFALDLMCTEHKSYYPGTAEAIEVNIRAEWMHHTFSEVRTHDLAKVIVDRLFNDIST